MASYSVRVKRDIGRWVAEGLIEPALADTLARDIDAQVRRSVSFGTILAMLAAILFGAAVLLVIAANWEAFPRIGRVCLIFTVIAAGYIGGAVLKQRNHPAFAEALWLIGAAGFGGAIALIGQMYHLAGDEAGAVLVWCIGTIAAAAALRSGVLNAAAIGLADVWMVMEGGEFWREGDFPYGFLLLAAVLWALSYWTRSAASRHLLLPSLIIYAVLMGIEDNLFVVSAALALVSAAAFAVATRLPRETERIVLLDGRLPLHALLGFLTGMTLVQFTLVEEPVPMVICAAIAFAGIAVALLGAGRESRGVRWLAYAGFAFELCFVYTVTLGSMLGSAGFFLAAAAILGILAFVIIRIEKRVLAPQEAVS